MRRSGLVGLLMILLLCWEASSQRKKPLPPDPLGDGETIELDRAIPANERGILCLATDKEGRVYGGTTGRAAHLFVYDPASGQVRSLVRLEGGIGFAYTLIRLPDGSLIGGTQADPTGIAVSTDEKAVGWLYRIVPGKAGKTAVEKYRQPVAGQGIYTLAYDEKTHTLFGNTWPDGHFFTVDLKSGKVTDHGAIAGYRTFETPRHADDLNKGVKKKTSYPRQVSKAIIVVPGVGAYTGGKDGFLYRYNYKTQKIAATDVRLPATPGREPWASLDVTVVHAPPPPRKDGAGQPPGPQPAGEQERLCGTSDGYLFQLVIDKDGDVSTQGVIRPSAQGTFNGLVALSPLGGPSSNPRPGPLPGPNPVANLQPGRFLGVVGHRFGMPRSFGLEHLGGKHSFFSVTPGGIPKADGQVTMVGFGAIIVDYGKGVIYAGENDRIARLIRYPINPKQAKVTRRQPQPQPKDLLGPPPEANLNPLKCKVVFAPEGTTTDGSGYTALEVGLDGNVYVGSARYGGYAWLLRFSRHQTGLFMVRVADMRMVTGENLNGINTQGKIHAIIIIGPDGRVWFATKQAHEVFGTRPEYGEDPEGYPGGHLCYHDPKTGVTRSVGILKKQEGLMAGAMDTTRNMLYYRSEPRNHFLSYNITTGEVKDRGHVGHLPRYFGIDKAGAVYGTARGDYLFRYDPTTGYVEDLAVRVVGPGHYSAPYVLQMGPNGKLYGAGTHHPWIMEFDIANYKKGLFPEVTVRNVAPAAPQGLPVQDIHAAVFGKDGKFYYPLNTTGPTEKGGKAVPHLRIMRFDPATAKVETVGIPDTSSVDESKVKHVYNRGDKYKLDHMQGAKVGPDGTLYLLDIYPQLNVACFPQLTAPKK